MPIYYFDTTALVKRYSPERGTNVVNRLLTKRGRVAILGTPVIPEFYALLAAKAHQGELTRDDWYSVVFKFESECGRGLFQYVAPQPQTYASTKELILEYPYLRAVQALHAALALELRPLRLSVVSSDQRLLEACRPLGLPTINPEEEG
ncbi:type II toxin-antitoxin system VapC family toxin [Nitrospira sp. Kam-Ns4a]